MGIASVAAAASENGSGLSISIGVGRKRKQENIPSSAMVRVPGNLVLFFAGNSFVSISN